jgi:hypothetical protein
MDDLAIWSRGLSECEVKSLYTGADTCLPSCEPCDGIDNNNDGSIDEGYYSCQNNESFTVSGRRYCFDCRASGIHTRSKKHILYQQKTRYAYKS